MSYQVIARKYRPQKFSEVVGQDTTVTILKNSILQNKTAHAYLFCGPRGTGKTSLARLLAKALNCEQKTEEAEPCGLCQSCINLSTSSSFDVLEIDGASHRGIDDIREINETVVYAPPLGKWKIYIIDEVHMLTKEAFNALLKTLEEPPPRVKFFFATTEPQKVPETIISRCQRFDLLRISEEKSVEKLKKVCIDLHKDVDNGALKLIARLAKGGLRDAESMLDQLLSYAPHQPITIDLATAYFRVPSTAYFFRLDQEYNVGNLKFAITLTAELFENGYDPVIFLEELAEHYRRILLLCHNSSHIEDPLFSSLSEGEKKSYVGSALWYQTQQSFFIFNYIIETLQKIVKSPYPKLLLENVFFTILQSSHRVSLDALVKRLILLETSLEGKSIPQVLSAQVNSISQEILSSIPSTQNDLTTHSLQSAASPSFIDKPSLQDSCSKEKEELASIEPVTSLSQAKYDTILQFAAVELEGTLKRRE